MIDNKLNYAMAQIRHLSPDIYLQINELWKQEIGARKVFKFKSVLIHLLVYLEDYLSQVQEKYTILEQKAKSTRQLEYVN